MGKKPDTSILLVDDDEAKRYTIAKTLAVRDSRYWRLKLVPRL